MSVKDIEWEIPESKKITCKICDLTDNTGKYYIDSNGEKKFYPSDMDFNIHTGLTVGKGKSLYWEMIWHKSGHVTVYSKKNSSPRYLDGDTEITIHFK